MEEKKKKKQKKKYVYSALGGEITTSGPKQGGGCKAGAPRPLGSRGCAHTHTQRYRPPLPTLCTQQSQLCGWRSPGTPGALPAAKGLSSTPRAQGSRGGAPGSPAWVSTGNLPPPSCRGSTAADATSRQSPAGCWQDAPSPVRPGSSLSQHPPSAASPLGQGFPQRPCCAQHSPPCGHQQPPPAALPFSAPWAQQGGR